MTYLTLFPFGKKEFSLLPVLTSHVGMLCFLGFDIFSDRELQYFVNGSITIKNKMQ